MGDVATYTDGGKAIYRVGQRGYNVSFRYGIDVALAYDDRVVGRYREEDEAGLLARLAELTTPLTDDRPVVWEDEVSAANPKPT